MQLESDKKQVPHRLFVYLHKTRHRHQGLEETDPGRIPLLSAALKLCMVAGRIESAIGRDPLVSAPLCMVAARFESAIGGDPLVSAELCMVAASFQESAIGRDPLFCMAGRFESALGREGSGDGLGPA